MRGMDYNRYVFAYVTIKYTFKNVKPGLTTFLSELATKYTA